jgi:hypothetical protein
MIVTQASELSISITEGETYDFNGQSLNSAGTYETVLVNAAGCDSVVTLTLTVNPALSCEITASTTSICAGESVELSVDGGAANTSICASSQFPANLQNGLVAYYPFCGNANDASGNGKSCQCILFRWRCGLHFNELNATYWPSCANDWCIFPGTKLPTFKWQHNVNIELRR